MPVQIIESGNLCNSYVAECPVCKSKVTYLGLDVKAHRNYPNGFVYCPKCRNPIPHDENNITTDGPSPEAIREKMVKNLLLQRNEILKQGRFYTTLGIVLFAIGAGCIGIAVGMIANPNFPLSVLLFCFGLPLGSVFMVGGLGLTISMNSVKEKRLRRIDSKLNELNYNPLDKKEPRS